MMAAFNEWASTNPDTAYLIGFAIIVALFYGLLPYKFGLNVATSKAIPFKSIDVSGQIRKPHRLALSFAAIAVFAFFHFVIGAPLVALVVGSFPVAALVATDYRQLERDSAPPN